MKLNISILLAIMSFLTGCSQVEKDAPGDFRTAQERIDEERKGSLLGKDALTWSWSQNADVKTTGDHLWLATSRIMSQYPISFNNFHARIIQTDWILSSENQGTRYRFTVRLLGKLPDKNNLDVLMMMETKQGDNWVSAVPNLSIRNTLIDHIVIEATRIYDQEKRD